MDAWPAERQRHKRSFEEMSHPATLSPSPIAFREPSTSNFFSASRTHFTPSASTDNIASLLERRRTSHPHNQPLQQGSEDMPERSQSHHRPRLEHQASQTVIDLTDEPEDIPAPSRNQRDRSRSQRPPQLGRSDAIGFGDFIDLTDENGEPDIIITGGRVLPSRDGTSRNSPALQAPRRREESPSLFVPMQSGAARHINRVFAAGSFNVGFVAGGARMERSGHGMHQHFHMVGALGQDFMDRIQMMQPLAMPGAMDYRNPAFAAQKPDHVPPKPARQDFTRSPTETDIIICPSCEEELIHYKNVKEEPVTKKGGKAPTKKEREEHPFWVVKDCGHVYCNNCYQHRALSGKHGAVSFTEFMKPGRGKGKITTTKALLCAVEDCESDVKNKDKWVGVFL